MCKFSLYMETKIPIRLNISGPEDSLGRFITENALEDFKRILLNPKFTIRHRRLPVGVRIGHDKMNA